MRLAFSAWLGRFCGALVTYYNLDVKEGAPELAISGTFKTIKGLADVANVQSAPVLRRPVEIATQNGHRTFLSNLGTVETEARSKP